MADNVNDKIMATFMTGSVLLYMMLFWPVWGGKHSREAPPQDGPQTFVRKRLDVFKAFTIKRCLDGFDVFIYFRG